MPAMDNYYKILGVTTAATATEIRRAYRILARRYHPDLNPGKASEDTFKKIAQAYSILSDAELRQQHDAALESTKSSFATAFDRAHRTYRKNQQRAPSSAQPPPIKPAPQATPQATQQKPPPHTPKAHPNKAKKIDLSSIARSSRQTLRALRRAIFNDSSKSAVTANQITQVSLLELSISIYDAIQGVRRTVELTDATGEPRKISAHIPPGVRTGSVVRFRRKEFPTEEVILMIRVATHPWLSLSTKGLTMEIPITINEAVLGGKIQVPSLAEPLLVSIEPGTQSGSEVRLKGQGVTYRDGLRGDLFIRFMVKIPEGAQAEGLRERCAELDQYYTHPIRQNLPRSILNE